MFVWNCVFVFQNTGCTLPCVSVGPPTFVRCAPAGAASTTLSMVVIGMMCTSVPSASASDSSASWGSATQAEATIAVNEDRIGSQRECVIGFLLVTNTAARANGIRVILVNQNGSHSKSLTINYVVSDVANVVHCSVQGATYALMIKYILLSILISKI